MKAWAGIVCVALAATVGVFAWQWHLRGGHDSVHENAGAAETPGFLCVDDLMQNVDRYRGVIRVEGVVSRASSAEQTLAVIDVEEFQQCGTTKCARLILPVRWTGAMPAVEDTVRMEGEVQDSGGKLVFVARKLEKVDTKAGGTK